MCFVKTFDTNWPHPGIANTTNTLTRNKTMVCPPSPPSIPAVMSHPALSPAAPMSQQFSQKKQGNRLSLKEVRSLRINQQPRGQCALHMALTRNAPVPVIRCLVDAAPDVLMVGDGREGDLPIMSAVKHGCSIPSVRLAVEADCQTLRVRNKLGKTALALAVEYGCASVITTEADRSDCSFGDGTDDAGENEQLPFAEKHCVDKVDTALGLGMMNEVMEDSDEPPAAKPTTRPKFSREQIEHDRNALSVIRYLLRSEPTTLEIGENSHDFTPVHLAVVHGGPGSGEVLRALILTIAEIHAAAAEATRDGEEKSSTLVEALRRRSWEGHTPLHLACGGGGGLDCDILRVLLEADADGGTEVDGHGMTPLHYLCSTTKDSAGGSEEASDSPSTENVSEEDIAYSLESVGKSWAILPSPPFSGAEFSPEEIQSTDDENLPSAPTPSASSGSAQEAISLLVKHCPQSVQIPDRTNRLPIHVYAQTQPNPSVGVLTAMLHVFPESLYRACSSSELGVVNLVTIAALLSCTAVAGGGRPLFDDDDPDAGRGDVEHVRRDGDEDGAGREVSGVMGCLYTVLTAPPPPPLSGVGGRDDSLSVQGSGVAELVAAGTRQSQNQRVAVHVTSSSSTPTASDALKTVEVFLNLVKPSSLLCAGDSTVDIRRYGENAIGVLRMVVRVHFRNLYRNDVMAYARQTSEAQEGGVTNDEGDTNACRPEQQHRAARRKVGWWMEDLITEMSNPPSSAGADIQWVSRTPRSSDLLSKALVLPHFSPMLLRTLFPVPPLSAGTPTDVHGNMPLHNSLLFAEWCSERNLHHGLDGERASYALTLMPEAATRPMVIPRGFHVTPATFTNRSGPHTASSISSPSTRDGDNRVRKMPLQFVTESQAFDNSILEAIYRQNRLACITVMDKIETFSKERDQSHGSHQQPIALSNTADYEQKVPRFVLAGAMLCERNGRKAEQISEGKDDEFVTNLLLHIRKQNQAKWNGRK